MGSVITIQVVYALPEEQQLIEVSLPEGICAREALHAVLEHNLIVLCASDAALERGSLPIGVYGLAVDDGYSLENGDRLEIYRPLVQDPKERRREMARRNR